MPTKAQILATINECIEGSTSSRKKTLGLPRLRTAVSAMDENDVEAIILLLEGAVAEPEPVDSDAPDTVSLYWINRHSWSLKRGKGNITSTRKKLDALIKRHRAEHPVVAPAPRNPVLLKTNTTIDGDMVTRMKNASRRADKEIVLLGHGETTVGLTSRFTVPAGTTMVFYTPDRAFLRDVDVRAIAAPEVWGRHQRPKIQQIATGGAVIQDHRIGELDPSGIGHTGAANQLGGTWMELTAAARRLSTILTTNMGKVHWAACRAHPTDDMIAFNAGHGENDAGPEEAALTEQEIGELALNGGTPA